MTEFLLLFRREATANSVQPSPEQMQAMTKQWQDWIGGIAAQNKLVSTGKRMDFDGKVVRPNKTITNGPYVEVKEVLNGMLFIKAADMDEALEIAKGCPILQVGGNVEVRPLIG